MDIADIYFAFHRPATFREIISGKIRWTMMFGHVEAFGVTIDATWFFFDPGGSLTKLKITHLHDEVEALLAEKFTLSEKVYRYSGEPLEFTAPVHGPMNCVTQCAALIGVRAFTQRRFQRILTEINAEVIHELRKQ